MKKHWEKLNLTPLSRKCHVFIRTVEQPHEASPEPEGVRVSHVFQGFQRAT